MKLCVSEECNQRGGRMDVGWQEAGFLGTSFPTPTPVMFPMSVTAAWSQAVDRDQLAHPLLRHAVPPCQLD